jgi:2-polyprenyl-6-methoxyphenol hydroxylase-like FAD-dependent oxidoreductase
MAVTAHFSDGSSATADVLIGADGANSRVRRQLLPHAERIDTGILAIAGKHRLDAAGARLPHALTHDVNMVMPAGRGFLFTAVWHPDRRTVRPDADPPEGFLLDNATAYMLWAYADASSQFPLAEGLDSLSGSDLRRLVLDGTIGWAPALRDLIAGSDPDTVNAIRVRSSTAVEAWQTGPVTLLGDAIHNMTPWPASAPTPRCATPTCSAASSPRSTPASSGYCRHCRNTNGRCWATASPR